LKKLNLAKKYVLAEIAFAAFEIIFGLLSSCLAMTFLGFYSAVSAFCTASWEVFPKSKLANVGFLALSAFSLLCSWVAVYNVHLTIGYADAAVDFWGLIPPISVFFAKACLVSLYSENEEVLEKTYLFTEIIDYKYDFLLIVSTILSIFLTFVFDFYIEYIVALGISLCCIRKVYLTAKARRISLNA